MCVNDTATQQTLVAFTELADQLASLHPLINNPWRAGMVSPINAGESIRFVHFGREYIFRMLKDAKSGFSWMLQQNILVIPAQENNLDSRVSVGDFQRIFL